MFECIMFQGNGIKEEVEKGIYSNKSPKKGKWEEKVREKRRDKWEIG